MKRLTEADHCRLLRAVLLAILGLAYVLFNYYHADTHTHSNICKQD